MQAYNLKMPLAHSYTLGAYFLGNILYITHYFNRYTDSKDEISR